MNGVGPLLAQLEATNLPGHLQHLTIRLSRQFALVLTSSASAPNNQHEHWTRLRGRLEEIEDELRDAATATSNQLEPTLTTALTEQARSYLALAEGSKTVREQLERELQLHGTQPAATPSRSSPSRDQSSSPEPARRRPASSASATAAEGTAQSALEAILQASSSIGPPPSNTTTAQAKAQTLSSAYTLHLLASSPATILPPGNTLPSLLRSQLSQDPSNPTPALSSTPNPPSLQDRVASALRTAYFAQAIEDLNTGLEGLDPVASSRVWTQLRHDLWTSAGPLIPARLGGGSVKKEVEQALTGVEGTFEMEKAMEVLRSVVELLGKLCAPARDGQVRDVLGALSSSSGTGSREAEVLVRGVQKALELAEGMQDDLSGFRKNLAGATMSDEELEGMVRREAGERERRAVSEVLDAEDGDVEGRTKEWVGGKLGEQGAAGWTEVGRRCELLRNAMWEALFEDQAVAVPHVDSPPPLDLTPSSGAAPTAPPSSNLLPPPFYVTSPRLFALQNTLQALVILACLQHLSPPPPPAPAAALPSSSASSTPSLQSRLWTLLSSTSSPETNPTEYSHLAHISDDILSAWASSRSSPLGEAEAEAERTRIRTSVDRILRYEDPVFRLMKGRLKEGLLGAGWASEVEGGGAVVPELMVSGRSLSTGVAPVHGSKKERHKKVLLPLVKGFEGSFVRERLEEAAREGLSLLEWAEEVWGEQLGL